MKRARVIALIVGLVQSLVFALPTKQQSGPEVANKPRSALSKMSDSNGRASESASSKPVPHELHIEVLKGRRLLRVYSGRRLVRACRIGLGASPDGQKEREGDSRTPVGRYYVCSKNPKSSYYLSLGLSYPNERDAKRGLRSGVINKTQYDEIVSANRNKARPPWNTPLGGEIFIHGNGAGSDWTAGCVAVENSEMAELFELIPLGTPVVIKP